MSILFACIAGYLFSISVDEDVTIGDVEAVIGGNPTFGVDDAMIGVDVARACALPLSEKSNANSSIYSDSFLVIYPNTAE